MLLNHLKWNKDEASNKGEINDLAKGQRFALFRYALLRRWAVIGLTVYDCMDAGGRVMSGAITEDAQLSALGQDVHMRDPNNSTPTRGAARPKYPGAFLFGYLSLGHARESNST